MLQCGAAVCCSAWWECVAEMRVVCAGSYPQDIRLFGSLAAI